MPRGSLKKYCRLSLYVQAKDPELAEAIEDLCLGRNLTTFRDLGLSWVMPTKPTRDKIVASAYGPNPEEAMNLINAHIIHDNLTESVSETSNKLGFKISVKKDGTNLELNKLKVKPAEDFKPTTGKRISAWIAVSGEPTLEGARAERRGPPPGGKKMGRPPKGARGGVKDKTYNTRQRMLRDVESAYAESLIRIAGGQADDDFDDPADKAAATVASVEGQMRLRANKGCEKCQQALKVVHDTVDPDPAVSAMMLLNPNQQTAETLINAYNEIGDALAMPVADASDYSRVLARASVKSGAAEAIRAARERINSLERSAGTANGPATSAIVGAYESLYRDNRIGGLDNVFSEESHAEYRRTGGAPALLRDLMRHDIATSLGSIADDVTPTTAEDIRRDVQSVFARARAVYGGLDSGSVQKALYMFNSGGNDFVKTEGGNVMDEVKMDFVNSSDFLYQPSAEAAVSGGAEGAYFFNRWAAGRYIGGGADVAAIRAEIQALP